jgi:hypothetical protein
MRPTRAKSSTGSWGNPRPRGRRTGFTSDGSSHASGAVRPYAAGHAAKGLKGVQMAPEEAGDVGPADELHVQRPRPGQHHHERPEPLAVPLRREKREPSEVDLGLLAGLRLEAHRRRHGPAPPERLQVRLQNRVAARVALGAELAKQHDPIFDAGGEPLSEVLPEGVELQCCCPASSQSCFTVGPPSMATSQGVMAQERPRRPEGGSIFDRRYWVSFHRR